MSEVGITQPVSQTLTRANASSKGAVVAQASESGKQLPSTNESGKVSTKEVEPSAKPTEGNNLGEAVASVNTYVQSIQRDLQFSVDEELEQTVIKVVDSGSGKLIRQIPEDVFLELARNLRQDGELQLVKALG